MRASEIFYSTYKSLSTGDKKKLCHILLELLQNAYHHGDNTAIYNSQLTIYHSPFIMSLSNPIKNTKVAHFKTLLERLDSCSAEELNTLYLSRLRDGKLTGETAGLGLLNIFRKAGKEISFNFVPLSNKFSQFTIKWNQP